MGLMTNWLTKKIFQLKEMGFFARETYEQVLERISTQSESSYFGSVANLQDHPLIDAILLSYDNDKVWFIKDWMTYTSNSSYPNYVDVLEKLSSISSGYFHPTQIKVSEYERDELISISYSQDEKLSELLFCTDGSVLVLSFLDEVNEQFEEYSFQSHQDPYGVCFVFFLNHAQQEFLSKSLDFEHKSLYWLDKARHLRQVNIHEADTCFQKALKSSNDNFPFAFSEYAYFMEEQGHKNRAKDLLQEAVKQLQDNKDSKTDWWLEMMQNHLNEMNEK